MADAARMRYRVKGTGVYVDASHGPAEPAYQAASNNRRLRTWVASAAGPNSALQFNMGELRRRSRDQIRQNPYAARASDAFVSNLVGTGIKPLSKADDEGLRNRIQDLWADWAMEADAAGRLDFYGLEALIARGWYEGGEVFIRRRLRRLGDGLTVPMQLQVLEGEFVPIEKNEVAASGNMIRSGIEYDPVGRRVAYHMYRVHPGDQTGMEIVSNQRADFGQTVRVPAEEVLHVYLPRRPGQERGEPWLTRSLVKLRDLDQYDDAELVRKKMAAMFLAFIKRVGDELPQFGEDDTHATGDEPDDTSVQTMEPGSAISLEDGEDVTFAKGEDVGGQYEVFMRQQLRSVAMGAMTTYEQLTGDYSQINDRTFRAAHNDLRRQIEALQQQVLVFQLCRPVWRWVMDLAVMQGDIRMPRAAAAARRARRASWIPQGFRYIHPVQEVQAERSAVRAGFKSRSTVVSERGEDVHEVDQEIAADNARADEAGLVLDTDPRKVNQSGAGQSSVPPGGDDSDEGDGEGFERRATNGTGGAAYVNGGADHG